MARIVAIDLGAHSVKVSVVRTNGRVSSLEGRYSQAVPQDGGPVSLGQRLAALDALIAEHPGMKGGGGLVAMLHPGSLATVHRMKMPFADEAQIERTLPFAVEAEVPFDMDEMALGWRVTKRDGGADVLAVLARELVLQERVDAMAARSLDPQRIIVDGDALAHVVPGGIVSAGGVCAVIDVGHEHTVVSIVQGDRAAWWRAVNVGGASFTRAIVRALGNTWDEAEAMKHGQRAASADQYDALPEEADAGAYGRLPQAARQAMDEAMGLLLAEVRSTLIRAEDTLGVEVESVVLTGGGARFQQLGTYLSRDLGLPIHRVVDEDGSVVPGTFAASHALAVELGQPHTSLVDLRVGDLAYRGGTDLLRAVFTYGVAGVAFFVVAASVMFTVQLFSLSSQLSEVEGLITSTVQRAIPDASPSQLRSTTQAVGIMAEHTSEAELRAQALGTASGGVPPTVGLLYDLTKAFPPAEEVDVVLSEINLSPNNITFSGETDGYANSARIEESLQKTERFHAAVKGTESKNTKGRIAFQITIPLGEDATADGEEG